MRISDWSSDVCSSDLSSTGTVLPGFHIRADCAPSPKRASRASRTAFSSAGGQMTSCPFSSDSTSEAPASSADRKSVVEGTSVSVRVGVGGRRIHKNTKKQNNTVNNETEYKQYQ